MRRLVVDCAKQTDNIKIRVNRNAAQETKMDSRPFISSAIVYCCPRQEDAPRIDVSIVAPMNSGVENYCGWRLRRTPIRNVPQNAGRIAQVKYPNSPWLHLWRL